MGRETSVATRLTKPNIGHILRSVAAITGGRTFVIVDTGAVIARLKNVPLDMMATRELDVYEEGPRSEQMSDLIDATLGEGSPFDETFGYYAHGVGERTARMPADWKDRARPIAIPNHPEVTCLCPDPNDIAIAKAVAWREKDREWLVTRFAGGVLSPEAMLSRLGRVSAASPEEAAELTRRIGSIAPAAKAKTPGGRDRTAAGPHRPKGKGKGDDGGVDF